MILNTLIFIFGSILLISAIMTFIVWLKYRNALLKTLLYFWLSGILGYFAQGYFSQTDTLGLFAFGFNAITINFLLRIYGQTLNNYKSLNLYRSVLAVTFVTGLAVVQSTGHYQWGSAIFCLGCFFSLIHGALTLGKKENMDFFTRGYQGLLIFAGLHFLDYPFFRFDLNLSIVGFSLSILFYFFFAIFVPILIIQKMSSEYTHQLEAEVELRTRQLHESYLQLRQTFEILKADKSQIKTLLSDNQIRMSALVHDIANPLQVIAHYFSMITSDPNKSLEVLEKKSERVHSAIRSIKQILGEARQTHSEIIGKSELTLKKVSLQNAVTELLKNFDERITEKKIQVEVNFSDAENNFVLANDGWLKNQVLSNLISNAIKFTKVGGHIRINAKPMDQKRVAIVIEDDGVGIPTNKRESIFDFDQQTSTKGTLGEEGTGLGLPIVKQYTELMGGKVVLLNQNKQGTTFQVELQKAA